MQSDDLIYPHTSDVPAMYLLLRGTCEKGVPCRQVETSTRDLEIAMIFMLVSVPECLLPFFFLACAVGTCTWYPPTCSVYPLLYDDVPHYPKSTLQYVHR